MSLELPEAHARALGSTRTVVVGIGADAWGADTPCRGWDVRALTNHVVSGNWWAAALAAGQSIAEVGSRLDGDVLGSDPVAEFDASAAAASAVFRAPGAMAAPCAVSYGPVPGEIYCGHRFLDVLVHGWDLAVATGQDATLDPELVECCIAVVEPQSELLVASGMFDAGVTAPDGSGRQAVLLAMLGRVG